VLFGRVLDTNDPDHLGREQVQLEGFEATVDLPWLRMLHPYASKAFGSFVLPEKDDEVAVLRGFGNHPAGMLVLGSLYNGTQSPPITDDGKNNIKHLTTRAGHIIELSDEKDAELIKVSTGDKLQTITMDMAEGLISIEADKTISIKAPNTSVTVDTTDLKVTATGKVDIKGDGDVTVKGGGNVTIDGGSAVTIKGSSGVSIDGGSSLDLAGGSINIG